MNPNCPLTKTQKIVYTIIFAIIVLISSIEIDAQSIPQKFNYKYIGPSRFYNEFDFTISDSANWELNFSKQINTEVNMIASFQNQGNWSELMGGADFLLLNIPLFEKKSNLNFRTGGKIGVCLEWESGSGGFSSVVYLRESIQLYSWRGRGLEKWTCKNKMRSINLICYQNLCYNHNGFFFQPRFGVSYRC